MSRILQNHSYKSSFRSILFFAFARIARIVTFVLMKSKKMSETICFKVDDAIKYGEEEAIILSAVRLGIHSPSHEKIEMNGIQFENLSERYFQSVFPYKSMKKIHSILMRLEDLKAIKVKKRIGFNGNEEIYIGLI